jgi:cytoskeletal protein CcmA (bactofilin family)
MICAGVAIAQTPPPRDLALAEGIREGVRRHHERWEHDDMQFDGKLNAAPVASGGKPGVTPTRSVIETSLTITGSLESEGELLVDGAIVGEICCAHLTVGKDATVEGNITAQEVVIRGKVAGTIRANRVILQHSACVESEICHALLSIEEGAIFNGRARTRKLPSPTAAQEEEAA